MTRTAATLIGLIAAVSASALLAAGPREDPAAGGMSPFDPAAGATTGVVQTDPARGADYFPGQFPDRGRTGAQPEQSAPTF
jgi:hypothetical protein